MFPAFQICARPIFSEKGKDIFSLVFCPPSIRAGGGASIRTRFCENYFLGKGFAKPRLIFLGEIRIVFLPAERGLGNECGLAFVILTESVG